MVRAQDLHPGYLSVYISLVHICCVCRALEDAAAKFIMWPGHTNLYVLYTLQQTAS